ncbi:hypothetical protein EPN90_03860 [Patescibacteria group bacterium]|nr:MAG: hypothetical protein EPN90_03860 [Patescibacteria group bacterium]
MKFFANKRIIILFLTAAAIAGAVLLFRSQAFTGALWQISNGGQWLLPLILVSAVIDSVNPCAFSVLLLTIAFLLSIGSLRAKILRVGLVYILGIFTVYLLIGLGILQVLHLFNTPHFMGRLGALLLMVLGAVNLLYAFVPKFPVKFRLPHSLHHAMATLMDRATVPTAFVLGTLVGLCEFPCTGGPYLMVLGLLHDRATYLPGVGYLLIYNLIFVSPLVVLLALASDKTLQVKVENWYNKDRRQMKIIGAIAMVLLGLIIFYL